MSGGPITTATSRESRQRSKPWAILSRRCMSSWCRWLRSLGGACRFPCRSGAGSSSPWPRGRGDFVTWAGGMAEVGTEAARFIFLPRRSDSPLDFDLEVAKAQSMENPVYYVQYAHARLSSVLREAEKAGVPV